uniref:Uncharacterized protein n=1 Tax=Quercus lobata TaxID=97700 RepID=A0A7N2L9E7_QUELO
MACRTALRFVFLAEPWGPVYLNRSTACASLRTRGSSPTLSLRLSSKFRTRDFHTARRAQLNCSHNETPSSSSDDQNPPQEAVLKAISEVSKTEGRVGQTTNVVIGGTVTDDSTNEWLALDQKVNSYPTVRGFTAIGTGGDDFVQAMVVAVESVIQQPIPEGDRAVGVLEWGLCQRGFRGGELEAVIIARLRKEIRSKDLWLIPDELFIQEKGRVRQKVSSRGKYVSVNIGPVQVVSSEQVQAVYNAMRRDERMKYFL